MEPQCWVYGAYCSWEPKANLERSLLIGLVLGDSRESVSRFAAAGWPCPVSLFFCTVGVIHVLLETSFTLICLPAGLICTVLVIIQIFAIKALGLVEGSTYEVILPHRNWSKTSPQPYDCGWALPGLQVAPPDISSFLLPGTFSVVGSHLTLRSQLKSHPFHDFLLKNSQQFSASLSHLCFLLSIVISNYFVLVCFLH